MSAKSLFDRVRVGPIELRNRVVMAPMTRNRAGEGNIPTDLMVLYYRQRAAAGLILTEATQISPEGVGYPSTPGIHSPAQVEGWTKVTRAVHEEGGRIFLQLWHVGRISHSLFQPGEKLPVAPSAIAPAGEVYTPQGMKPFETPRALELSEIPRVIEDYRAAAKNALAAGFDGVEIHGANGYLLDQFLQDGANRRTDTYGGSIENRVRLLREVTEAVVEVWGANRVGVRLSPNGSFNDMKDSNPQATFSAAIRALDAFGLAYLHMRTGTAADVRHGRTAVPIETLRPLFRGPVILNDGFDRQRAETAINRGLADLVAFGVPYLANPDLPKRLETNAPLNEPDTATFYGGGAKGYTDYPSLEVVSRHGD